MQVSLDKEYPVAARADTAWRLLTDIHELTLCMPGAQITEDIDATHYKGSVKMKVGPAVAAFAGTIEVLALDPAVHTLRMLGKGADKGGSSASMELTAVVKPAADGSSILHGKADVIVNGKFAQFGGRMMTSVSDVILAQFAAAFSEKAKSRQAAESPPASPSVTVTAGNADSSSPATSPPAAAAAAPSELNALGLMWAMARNWLAGLFGRKT